MTKANLISILKSLLGTQHVPSAEEVAESFCTSKAATLDFKLKFESHSTVVQATVVLDADRTIAVSVQTQGGFYPAPIASRVCLSQAAITVGLLELNGKVLED